MHFRFWEILKTQMTFVGILISKSLGTILFTLTGLIKISSNAVFSAEMAVFAFIFLSQFYQTHFRAHDEFLKLAPSAFSFESTE